MEAEERKQKLQELIQNQAPCRTGIPIMYHGVLSKFDAYEIPLDFLVYNPYNGRIGSVVKSYERQHHQLDPENTEDKKIIEKFLWDSKPEANKKTRQRILREHQQKHGIVTADGSIIDGNRRAMLLNSLRVDENIPLQERAHCNYFVAIILPEDADKKEILALETTYQMGEDAKVDYNPIEKYLKCKDLQDEGFTVKEIAEMMDCRDSEVRTMLSCLDLMDDYLETYQYDGMYTQLDKNEDSFLKLDAALRKYKAGVPSMWAYDPEADVSDLKLLAFDYIRSGFDQNLFRNIISAPTAKKANSSFFANEEIWNEFSTRHFEAVDGIAEEDVESILERNPSDLVRALKARDKTWTNKVQDDLEDNFEQSLDKLRNRDDANKPLQLLIKACQALEVVDCNQEGFKDNSAVQSCVEELEGYIEKFKAILNA